jgi:hypothetical protein
LVDYSANFSTVVAGDIVINTSTGEAALAVSLFDSTQIILSANIFTSQPQNYTILSQANPREAEKISHSKSTLLNTSLLTTPNSTFPAYTQEGSLITVFPTTINLEGMVKAQYFRFPYDPKWTYVTITGGTPSFDQSQSDYQDFELGQDEEVPLIIKICQYCGIQIREQQVYEFAKREQQENDQPKV